MAHKRFIINYVLLALFTLLLVAAASKTLWDYSYEKSHYSIGFTTYSRNNTPMIFLGTFFYRNGQVMVKTGNYHNFEPETNDEHYEGCGGAANALVPDRFTVKWFSYTQNTFYSIDQNLDADNLELLQENDAVDFRVTVDDAGICILTVNGQQYGRYTAKEIQHKWPAAIPRETSRELILTTADFRPQLVRHGGGIVKEIGYETFLFGQEYFSMAAGYGDDSLSVEKVLHNGILHDSIALPKGIPRALSLEFDGREANTDFKITFNAKEMLAAYKSVKTAQNAYGLKININDKDSVSGVVLDNGHKQVALKKYSIENSY